MRLLFQIQPSIILLLNNYLFDPKLKSRIHLHPYSLPVMNQDNESSSSSPPSAKSKVSAEIVGILLDLCKQLREKVESVQSMNTLTFYFAVIFIALEAVQTMINRINTMFPAVEVDEIKSCEYFCEKACEINKEIIQMSSNVLLTSCSTNNIDGGLKKLLVWKKQCSKKIEKIEFLIKHQSLRVYSTYLGAYMLDGTLNGVAGIFAALNSILILKESEDDQQFINKGEEVFQDWEKGYRNVMNERLDIALQGIKQQSDRLEESSLKNSQEEALEKLQEDDIPKRFEEDNTVMKKNFKEEKSEKNSQEVAAALEKAQEDDIVKRFHEQTTVMKKNLQQEGTCQKKIEEEENYKKLHEDGALKKLKEEKIVVAEDEIKEFKIGGITVRMKNGVVDLSEHT